MRDKYLFEVKVQGTYNSHCARHSDVCIGDGEDGWSYSNEIMASHFGDCPITSSECY